MEVLAAILSTFVVVVLGFALWLRRSNASLRAELSSLARFRDVLDAEALATEVLESGHRQANEEISRARAEAERLIAESSRILAEAEKSSGNTRAGASAYAEDLRQSAERAASETRARATAAANDLRARAEQTLLNARTEADRIVEAARARAHEIAGDALLAVEDARKYEQIATAMKNVIEGYGDRYIIPSQSLLDELAEEYGFTQAGEELKKARQRVRDMIKMGTAATCDYVEQVRRQTAVTFVIDAFNGKVDTILAKVRHDNYGTLRQEILDAFALVNANGAAFKGARILPAYRDARLGELQCAAVAQELKLKEKEEQRLIKERIREEERAQREFERAMKEASKEEEMLKKALEKVQKQVAEANDEQRAKYEAQLADLQAKLIEAEAKAQRALSMAQQTKSGHVYVISNVGSFGDDVFKIGMTRRLEPTDRVRELGDASVPFEFDVHAMIQSDDAPALEHALHKCFVQAQVNKVNPRKEFFRVPLGAIRGELDRIGIKTKWTVAAEARQYRETLALEEAMRKEGFDKTRWLEEQMKAVDAIELDEEEEAA
jgi:hypothetical protein